MNFNDMLAGGEMYELALVMPIYNEEECIISVVNEWINELVKLKIDFKMILLNDGSVDCTSDKLSVFDNNDRVTVIDKPNSGHGPTILVGYDIAAEIGEWVFQTDSDNEMKPDYFFELWNRRKEYSALFGVRVNRQQNIGRKFISAAARVTVQMFFKRGIKDVNTPYRLIRATSLKPIIHQIPGDTFAPNVIISGALAVSNAAVFNFPVPHEPRKTGSVSIVKWKLWKAVYKSFLQTVKCRFQFFIRGYLERLRILWETRC